DQGQLPKARMLSRQEGHGGDYDPIAPRLGIGIVGCRPGKAYFLTSGDGFELLKPKLLIHLPGQTRLDMRKPFLNGSQPRLDVIRCLRAQARYRQEQACEVESCQKDSLTQTRHHCLRGIKNASTSS